MKSALFPLLAILILAPCMQASQEARASVSSGLLQENYKVSWKLPAEDFSFPFTIQTSEDGKRVLVEYSSAYSAGAVILDDEGKKLLNVTLERSGVLVPIGVAPTMSALTSEGGILVSANTIYRDGNPSDSVLAWHDVDTGHQLRSVTIDEESTIYSLSISHNADLVTVSGVVWGNYTFIDAFDSQGRELWKQLFKARELVGYYESLYVHSNVAVSGDGSHVAAALRDQSVRFGLMCGGRNGVIVFDSAGKLLWNYTTPECVWNTAISEGGQYVLASGDSHLYGFTIDGRVLWNMPLDSAIVATAGAGEGFIAGDFFGGRLVLGNAGGSYWEMNVNGEVESVGISDSGNVSAAVISREYPDTRTERLLYVMDDRGTLLANYTSVGSNMAVGSSRVAVSGNGCCIVAALETDGIYYLQGSKIETQTTTVSSSITSSSYGVEQSQTLAAVLLIGASGLAAFLLVRNYRSHVKTRGKVN